MQGFEIDWPFEFCNISLLRNNCTSKGAYIYGSAALKVHV